MSPQCHLTSRARAPPLAQPQPPPPSPKQPESAVCTIGLEAAHIRWHQHGGPDVEENGVALCSTHHKLFDLGAFTVQDGHAIAVSGLANGNEAFASLLLDRHGQPLQVPRDAAHHPHPKDLAWHRDEVFRAPAFGLGR